MKRYLLAAMILSSLNLYSQTVINAGIDRSSGLVITNFTLSDNRVLSLDILRPLLSFNVDNKLVSSSETEVTGNDSTNIQSFSNRIKVTSTILPPENKDWKCEIVFENISPDTLIVSNVVPFGENRSSVYLTGFGPPDLARACLFRPGFRPVRVILPDNAWELGYNSFSAGEGLSVCAIARRQKTDGGQRRRYETVLPPSASVTYLVHAGIYSGEWQNGLRLMFRDRYLYDLGKFDNSLYERQDLAWIRDSYLIILQMAWDREFYDRLAGKYNYGDFLRKQIETFGSVDAFVLWPTWPRLGLDQRNQWDLYSDLPGGTEQLRSFSRMSRPYGTRFFIAYNPWDNSTRQENHLKGLARMIGEIEADGVVLDTYGSTTGELRATVDSVRKGVVMYSEAMALPKDMPGILTGRVHNAIFLSPELNLNKLIKPDIAIFRVCDAGEDIIHREIAIAFFNGYGTELHQGRPGGRNEEFEADRQYLARTTFILRQNSDAFLDQDWTPFIETAADNIFVNRWTSGEEQVFTILNMRPEGFAGKLFRIPARDGKHYVSLWNHENVVPEKINGDTWLSARADGWIPTWSGTRREGSVDCIAEFSEILKSELKGDSVRISMPREGRVTVWKGNPSYGTAKTELNIKGDTIFRLQDLFGYYEGKIVIQLVEGKNLKDENILSVRGGKPWLVSKTIRTPGAVSIPSEMILVPGTAFSVNVSAVEYEEFIKYPEVSSREVRIDSFLIDRYPVTNAQYYEFITKSGYVPADTARYLRHWSSGTFRQGQDNYPVVYLSLEDMKAYAAWAGKRLPSQAEWQLAAQGTDGRKWPWGNEFHGTLCNNSFGRPTPVNAFPKGKSPYDAMDMVGNVWQMTGDMYFNGNNYYTIIRGGSYYNPESSWWYVKGGPQPLDKTQIMLLVSPGYDRSSTVGFRCAKDIAGGEFRVRK
ncbi:MAG: formylglycine-generating enzyme family protein [Bacteroidales bacterium]|jgi:formylglycine-generating enzyme required for sulfatase activity|nr:formylglycine-generating enzyme family protein [Bacteroidales bacterium]